MLSSLVEIVKMYKEGRATASTVHLNTHKHCLPSPLSVQAVISSHYTLPSPSPLTFSSSHTDILSDSKLSVSTRQPHFTHFTSRVAPTSPSLPLHNPLTLSRTEEVLRPSPSTVLLGHITRYFRGQAELAGGGDQVTVTTTEQ